MPRHVHISIFGATHASSTLTGSCGAQPGLACRLVWDVSHNGQAAQLTNNFLAGPVHLLLRVLFVVLLALVIRAVLHRVINRLTERASQTLLPQLKNGVVSSRIARGRRRRRARGGSPDGHVRSSPEPPASPEAEDSAAARAAAAVAEDAGGARNGSQDAADLVAADLVAADSVAATSGVTRAGEPGVAEQSGAADTAVSVADTAASVADTAASVAGTASAAASVEHALVDERRRQRVRALGSILRSASSITIFAIAGVVILGDLGINLAPLLASAGVVGIAIGFGAQNLVRDYLSGVFMLLEDQYGVGDVISVGNATGTVETVTLRITRMRDVNGIAWHIRNGAIETVGNESQGWARAVVDYPVPYAADLSTIKEILANAAESMWAEPLWRAVMLDTPEVWGAQEVKGSQVTMRVVVKTAPLQQWGVEREMRARIKAALDTAGITPPSG
ncbi:MAG TPA: mechanosensitive ion channel family protein [Trebonia sp.]|nr:mechanosensitive ion channel family protein [Trebonia sp.]